MGRLDRRQAGLGWGYAIGGGDISLTPWHLGKQTSKGEKTMATELGQVLDMMGAEDTGKMEYLRHQRVLLYRTKTITAGDYVDVECYPIYTREGRQEARRAKALISTEERARYNEQQAIRWFWRKLNANFTDRDFHVTLTYSRKAPEELDGVAKDFARFIRRVNYRLQKRGMEACRYMAVIERGEKNGRPHLHAVMRCGLGRDELEDVWGLGYCNADRLKPGKDGLKALGKYMTKGRDARAKGKKRWLCSKNLKMPRVTVADHKVTRREAQLIAQDAELNGQAVLLKKYPGAEVTELRVKMSERVAGAYIYASLYRPAPHIRQSRTKPDGRSGQQRPAQGSGFPCAEDAEGKPCDAECRRGSGCTVTG